MKGETHTPGRQKTAFSPALANKVGLRVPGLISLAVRLRTTGPRLAQHQVPRYELKSVFLFFFFSFLKEAFFLTKEPPLAAFNALYPFKCNLSPHE